MVSNSDFFCECVQAEGDKLSKFLELVMSVLTKSISTWSRKRRLFERIRDVYLYEPISPNTLALASALIARARAVSGANVATHEGFKVCEMEVVARFGHWSFTDVDSALVKRLRSGCASDPELAKPQEDYTPFHPALVLVWAACINPVGLREGRFPDGKSADFLLIEVFKLATCLCSRGLRGKDFMMYKEKDFNAMRAVESPQFRDVIVYNDVLQIKFNPPFIVMRSPRKYKRAMEVIRDLEAHPATGIKISLRGLKNHKDANFKVDLELSRVKYKDICPVFHFMNILKHRVLYYPSYNWRYVLAIPKVALKDVFMKDFGWVHRGSPAFFPLTRKRFGECWADFWKRIFGGKHYDIHNIRSGLQTAISRATMLGGVAYSEDLRRQTGNWKRPKGLIWESYGGHDEYLLDIKYQQVLEWDLNYLLGRLPFTVQEDLMDILLWVWQSRDL